MAKRKAVYFVVTSGIDITDAIGTPALLVGPCSLRSVAMDLAKELIGADDTTPGYDVVKAHFDIVDTFTVQPAIVAAFVRS